MSRADLLVNLVRAGSRGDSQLFRQTVEAIIAEERAKQHHVLAERLSEYLKSNGSIESNKPIQSDERVQNLLLEITPHHSFKDLLLSEGTLNACRELVEEHHRLDLLRSYNLEPRHRILLAGPPGNGKTSLAEAIAESLMIPLFAVRYEGVIGSYLGETAVRLRKVFDFVRTRRCMLFFDEFDALGKERGDVHETGEIKRVVSSLLLQIDSLPSHVVVVTATNHPELLDRAVWRRFQLRVSLPTPSRDQAEKWFQRFEKHFGQSLGVAPDFLAHKLVGLSFSELEEFCLDIRRRFVLALPDANLKQLIHHQLKQWQARFSPTESMKE